MGLATLTAISCKEEKKPNDIVVQIPAATPKKQAAPQKREASHWEQAISWRGATYTIRIDRTADSTVVATADGQRYYDNRVTLQVVRADGSMFVDKTFHKADFLTAAKGQYAKDGVLLGMAFDRSTPDGLSFGASIGDPNPDSDEFVPLTLTINPQGKATITEAVMSDDEVYD